MTTADPLIPGYTYTFTNLNTTTEMHYDTITKQVLGYPGDGTTWLAENNTKGQWSFTTTDGTSNVSMAYSEPAGPGSPVIGSNALYPVEFDISPGLGGSVIFKVPNIDPILAIQLSIPGLGSGIPAQLALYSNSTLQMWTPRILGT